MKYIQFNICNKCHLILEMELGKDQWLKLRHPRRMIGYIHHHKIHHRAEQGYNSMSHKIRVKIIKTEK